ncbi:MAG: hypothetical protein JWQ04_1057 [Pedosphaera sp.]|nr:hypothetical protein [Pedosphaera sp.]
MKTLYLDIFSGISGDMLIGALLDLGASATELGQELKNSGSKATICTSLPATSLRSAASSSTSICTSMLTPVVKLTAIRTPTVIPMNMITTMAIITITTTMIMNTPMAATTPKSSI